MTKKIGVATLAFCISLPASAQTNDDPIKWAWTCKSSGFYSIHAFPNGSYKPEVDFTGNPRVVINIRAASKDRAEFCGSPSWRDFYYAEMQGADLATLYNGLHAPFCNEAKLSFENSTINKVTGSKEEMSIIVNRDDNDWRFVVSGTDLTTEREGRRLRILAPRPGINYDAKAGVWMLTGQCIITVDHAQ